jgi:hypothetical protein
MDGFRKVYLGLVRKVFVGKWKKQEGGKLQKRMMSLVVYLILDGKTERALYLLSEQFNVSVPTIKVGLPKGRRSTVLGCYSSKDRTISVLNSDALKDPFIVLHEFYHHLRTTADAKHKGSEKYADEFAKQFIEAFKADVKEEVGND